MKENAAKPQSFKSVPLIIRDEKKEIPETGDTEISDAKNDGVGITEHIVEDEAKEMLKTPELEPAPVEVLLPRAANEAHLLEEKITAHEVKDSTVIGGVSYDDQIKKIVSTARLSPPAEMSSRYQSLLTSYLKGIRTAEQVLDYARLPIDRGGLALDEAAAARLQAALGKDPMANKPQQKTIMKPEISAPISMPKPMPRSVSSLPSPAITLPSTTMRDIQAPIPTGRSQSTPVMGPVDEMKNFSLRDWRRLAATPDKSKEIILNKFKSWKEESFFLYQDTRSAWFFSPLFRMYQETVAKAVNNASRLADLTLSGGARDALTATDINALIEVNRSLSVY